MSVRMPMSIHVRVRLYLPFCLLVQLDRSDLFLLGRRCGRLRESAFRMNFVFALGRDEIARHTVSCIGVALGNVAVSSKVDISGKFRLIFADEPDSLFPIAPGVLGPETHNDSPSDITSHPEPNTVHDQEHDQQRREPVDHPSVGVLALFRMPTPRQNVPGPEDAGEGDEGETDLAGNQPGDEEDNECQVGQGGKTKVPE
jgi:hypothetical protein